MAATMLVLGLIVSIVAAIASMIAASGHAWLVWSLFALLLIVTAASLGHAFGGTNNIKDSEVGALLIGVPTGAATVGLFFGGLIGWLDRARKAKRRHGTNVVQSREHQKEID